MSLYLHILSAFVLGGLGIDNAINENLLTTSVIAIIMVIGVAKGLKPLEILERWAFYITLVIIVLLAIGVSKSAGRRAFMAIIAAILALITIFAVPAS